MYNRRSKGDFSRGEMMPTEQQKRFEPLIVQEEHIKKAHIHHDPLLTNWGIFTEETAKALIASGLRRERLYENMFRQPDTAVSSQVETLLNWLLDHKVLILEPAHIRNYLIRHFDLIRILRSTCKLALDL